MSGYAEWSPFATYEVNNVVTYDGIIYVCLAINVNRSPPSFPTFWSTSGAGSSVTSILAGSNIGVNANTGTVTVTNTGVRTLTGGTGIVVNNTDPRNPIVSSGGVSGATANQYQRN